MIENVFKVLIEQQLIRDIQVQEVLPTKGKPAKMEWGSSTVWIVKLGINDDQVAILEAVRGGAREWASLDNLTRWLKTHGVEEYRVNFLTPDDSQINLDLVVED